MRPRWGDVGVIVVALAFMLSAACSAPGALCDEEECGSIAQRIEPCESFGCGGNARISGFVLHELHPYLPNPQGLIVVGFRSGTGAASRLPVGTSMVLDIQGDRLRGLVDGQPPIEGAELVGAAIHLRTTPGGYLIPLQIQEAGEAEFWFGADAGPARAAVYKFHSNMDRDSICDYRPPTTEPPGDPTITIDTEPAGLAIVFAGDRYHPNSDTVDVPGESGWFNIACVGTALAKMHLLRQTSAGSGSATSPSQPQRQAMLKLLSADYCGDGRAYARNGTPLFFRDQEGRFDPTPLWGDRLGEFEAIWTDAGALCLDEPRPWDPTRVDPDARAQIVAACESSPVESRRRTIPPCTAEQLASWQSLGPISRNVDPL